MKSIDAFMVGGITVGGLIWINTLIPWWSVKILVDVILTLGVCIFIHSKEN